MYDYYLSTIDAETMEQVLVDARVAKILPEVRNEEDEVVRPRTLSPNKGVSIDVLGVWYETDEETLEQTQVPGYHFNVRSQTEVPWPKTVTSASPQTPWRVWA